MCGSTPGIGPHLPLLIEKTCAPTITHLRSSEIDEPLFSEFERLIRLFENPETSEPEGWRGSLVLNSAFQSNQPKATSRSSEERPANRMLVVRREIVAGGLATRPNHADMRPNPRVFVVDDEEFIRDLYRDVFESRGMTVFSAQSGEEAVKIFSTMRYKPDVVIMDHRMPGKDGIETTREILKMDPSIPIIFSSADETVRDAALEAGAVSFWAKPFPVGLLVNAMVDLVEARKKKEDQHYH